MSFYTKLEVQYLDGSNDIRFDGLQNAILEVLKSDGVHKDVFSDLRAAFEQQESSLAVHAAYVLQLIEDVARMAPYASFSARCGGEEHRHTWIREFKNGQETFAAGPWDYET